MTLVTSDGQVLSTSGAAQRGAELSLISRQVVELGWRYNPLEHRNEHGEWSRDGSEALKALSGMKWGDGKDYEHPPADRVAKTGAKASENPFIKKYGLSAKNIVVAYDDSTPEERDQGARWYSDAHTVARMMGGGDADKGAALLSTYSPQTDWQTNALNAAHAIELGHSPEKGVGISGATKAKANAILARPSGSSYDDLFNDVQAPKTAGFYRLIRNGGDKPGDTEGDVVIDRHALSVAAGRRLTKDQTETPSVKDVQAEHPDWAPEEVAAYRKSLPSAPVSSVYTYQHIADMYREAARQVSERDGVQVSPHQMQAITWLRQQRKNNEADAALVAQAEKMIREGTGKMGAVPGAKEAKGRFSRAGTAWKQWEKYAAGHTIATHMGTTAVNTDNPISFSLISQQAIELRSDAWRFEARDHHGRWTRGAAGVIEKIVEPIGDEGARGNSREVSHDEFQRLASEGRDRLREIQARPWGTEGMDRNWGAIKQRTWDEVQKSWGGATIDPRTGEDLPQGADKFAMSIKPSGLDTTSIPEHASLADFSEAMDIARSKYGKQLAKGGSYLGVFHDDDLNRIDIDPVTVLDSLREVETIGSYTHAIGGAYRFSDGNGYWPPHVAGGASMAGSDHSWAGPGQWHSHAVSVQQPHDEPEDKEEPGLISAQVIGLSWRDAWMHESRGAHGEWMRGLGGALAGAYAGVRVPEKKDDAGHQAMHRLVSSTAGAVPGMFSGDDHLDWDGKPPSVLPPGQKGLLAEMDWNGHMSVAREVMDGITSAGSDPGPIKTPGSFEVTLHEMIHGVVPNGESRATNGDREAYGSSLPHADIEEGFTELGAIQHAGDFFRAAGVHDREVSIPGSPAGATMGELADNINTPDAIKSGNAWGHYPAQTAQAFNWVSLAAQMRSGKPESDPATADLIRQYSDRVNAVGTADKPHEMAMIEVYDMLTGDRATDAAMVASSADAITRAWDTGDANDAHQAARQAAQAVQAERKAA